MILWLQVTLTKLWRFIPYTWMLGERLSLRQRIITILVISVFVSMEPCVSLTGTDGIKPLIFFVFFFNMFILILSSLLDAYKLGTAQWMI